MRERVNSEVAEETQIENSEFFQLDLMLQSLDLPNSRRVGAYVFVLCVFLKKENKNKTHTHKPNIYL